MKEWITEDGTEIPYNKIEDNHLVNIIKYVKKRAKELDGKIIAGGGEDSHSYWADIGSEEDWLEHYDYKGLVKELSKRKLANKKL